MKTVALRIPLVLILILLLAAIAGSWLPHSSKHDLTQAFCTPSKQHVLGCDAFGSDLSARILAGAAKSLRIGLIVTLFTMTIGLILGTLAAILPARAGAWIMRVVDYFLAFPSLLLAILLASLLKPGEVSVVFALTLTGWTSYARLSRALAKKTLSQPFIEAARSNGASQLRIVFRHIWPSIAGQIAIQCAIGIGYVILGEASLSFFGFGGPLDNPSWGQLIAEGREYLVEAPHLSLFPGIALGLSVLAFNLLAEALRGKLDSWRL